jgi:hypothetical protein
MPHHLGGIVSPNLAIHASDAVGKRIGFEWREPMSNLVVQRRHVAQQLDGQPVNGKFTMARGAVFQGRVPSRPHAPRPRRFYRATAADRCTRDVTHRREGEAPPEPRITK